MENDGSTYALNAQQFEQALAILQREQQASTPSLRQEKIFKLLNIAVYGYGIAAGIWLLIGLLFERLQRKFDSLNEVLAYIVVSFLFLLPVGITILFLLNRSYVRQLLRQSKLVRRLGLLDALRAPWRTERRKKRWRNVLDLGVRILGLVGFSLMLFVIVGVAVFSPRMTESGDLTFFSSVGALLLGFTVVVAIIVTYVMRQSKERLELISRLYSSLEEHKEKVEQDEDHRVPISAKVYEKIAQIERAQISRERVQSILGSLEEPGKFSYVLQKSHAAQQAQASLDATTRLRVQDQIDALMTEPRAPGVTEDPKAGPCTYAFPRHPSSSDLRWTTRLAAFRSSLSNPLPTTLRHHQTLDDKGMAAPEFPEYATSYAKTARALRDALPEQLRATLIEIEAELTENPDKYPPRLILLGEDLFIYKHPQPAIEITYRIDRDRKILYFLHLATPTLRMSKTLFISYSHEDEQWLLELKKWLKPLEQRDLVTIWDDQKIKAGAEWRQEIEKALASAKAAVLLISVDFLNSEFIANNELPQLLNAARQRGLNVFWIAVRPSTVDETEIAKFQAAHKEPPLSQLGEAEREVHLLNIYKKIREVVSA